MEVQINIYAVDFRSTDDADTVSENILNVWV